MLTKKKGQPGISNQMSWGYEKLCDPSINIE